MRTYGYTIRQDSNLRKRFEERGGFPTREARDLAAKRALKLANQQRPPSADRYTAVKWSSTVFSYAHTRQDGAADSRMNASGSYGEER